jgi:hypothetical protein
LNVSQKYIFFAGANSDNSVVIKYVWKFTEQSHCSF